MRIAQVVASLEARHGGPSRSVLGLARGLAAQGAATELLTTDSAGDQTEADDSGLTVRRFRREWPQRVYISSSLAGHLDATRYDIVHAHGLWIRPLHYAACSANRYRVPLIISPRGMMTPWAWQYKRTRKQLAAWLVHPRAFARADGWHATSEDEAREIRELGFEQPICVSPNGIDLPGSSAQAAARAHWTERCPELGGRRCALFYSRFHPKKRVLELIDLWLARAPADWHLLMVGIPETYDVAQLRDHVTRNRGTDRISIHAGNDAPPPYAVAELYLLPSHSENFGLTVAEALAHGVPVLTTDATPWSALATKGAGSCVPWDSFGAALVSLLEATPGDLATRGRSGRAWMAEAFTWEQAAAKLLAFYRTLGAQ